MLLHASNLTFQHWVLLGQLLGAVFLEIINTCTRAVGAVCQVVSAPAQGYGRLNPKPGGGERKRSEGPQGSEHVCFRGSW